MVKAQGMEWRLRRKSLVFSQIFIARMSGPFVEGIDWNPILTREDEDLVALFTLDEIK